MGLESVSASEDVIGDPNIYIIIVENNCTQDTVLHCTSINCTGLVLSVLYFFVQKLVAYTCFDQSQYSN